MWSEDKSKLISNPSPKDFDEIQTILSASKIEYLYSATQQTVLSVIIGERDDIERRGYVDTTRGVVLLTADTISLERAKSTEWHKKQGSERKETTIVVLSKHARCATRAQITEINLEYLRRSVHPLDIRHEIPRCPAKKNHCS